MKNKLLYHSRGQAVVVVALMMVGLIAMMGLVFDGGNVYLQRRRMQNAADAGAYAGAKVLAVATNSSYATECSVRYAVEKYAVANGVSGSADSTCNSLNSNVKVYFVNSSNNQVGIELPNNSGIPTGAVGIRVVPNTSFNTFFLGVVNQPIANAAATATAAFGGVNHPPDLQPLAIQCTQSNLASCFTFNQVYDLYDSGGSGNKGWVSWNGSNSATYTTDELDHTQHTSSGYDDPHNICTTLGVGCWVQGGPGVKNSSGNRTQLDWWVSTATPMTIIIYDTTEGNGSNVNFHAVGFASFVVTGYDLPHGLVSGKFVKMVIPGEICYTCMDTGTRTIGIRQ